MPKRVISLKSASFWLLGGIGLGILLEYSTRVDGGGTGPMFDGSLKCAFEVLVTECDNDMIYGYRQLIETGVTGSVQDFRVAPMWQFAIHGPSRRLAKRNAQGGAFDGFDFEAGGRCPEFGG